MNRIAKPFALSLTVALALPLSGFADEGKNESGQREKRANSEREYRDKEERRDDRHRYERRGDRDEHRSYFHEHGYSRLSIPRGHYPPPGECRIWYPDRPPGHQPPPGNCRQLSSRVPPGAWLIRHPGDDRGQVHVNIYDRARPGITIVGVFDIESGKFLRELR